MSNIYEVGVSRPKETPIKSVRGDSQRLASLLA